MNTTNVKLKSKSKNNTRLSPTFPPPIQLHRVPRRYNLFSCSNLSLTVLDMGLWGWKINCPTSISLSPKNHPHNSTALLLKSSNVRISWPCKTFGATNSDPISLVRIFFLPLAWWLDQGLDFRVLFVHISMQLMAIDMMELLICLLLLLLFAWSLPCIKWSGIWNWLIFIIHK